MRALLLLGLVSLAIIPAYAEEPQVSFGDRQVAQLLDDRPSMEGAISPEHPIYHWVVEKFETGALGDRVYWDHHEPISGAGHVYSRPTVVRVTSDPSVSGSDKWGMLIFEMFNLQWAAHRTKLSAQAARDEVGKSKFATEQLRLEVRALRETQQFFRR